jgi:hypothetical protein
MSKKSKYELEDVGPLGKLGEKVISNGYAIVPIAVGKKAPMFDGWEKSKSTARQLDDWIEHGHRHSGMGIMCKDTPGVDLDIRDEELVELAEAKARELLGDAPVRIGQKPKRLLMYRTDEPFKKLKSKKYLDDTDWPEHHQIEILGDGQQFVAFHIHPDTGKPYTWPNGDGPDVTAMGDLPIITREQCQQLLDWFEDAVATLRPGWKAVKGTGRKAPSGDIDWDDPFLEDTPTVELSEDELRDRLMMLDSDMPHDQWVEIGMALYHQFDGGDVGLEMWHDWSETGEKYEKDVLNEKWKSFDVVGKGKAPITARLILKLSKEAADNKTVELSLKLRDAFNEAKTKPEWEKARRMANEAEIDGLTRAALAPLAKDRLDIITGTKTPLAEVKKAIAYQPSKGEDMPGWCEPWVYDTSDDRFYSTKWKVAVTQQGFNAMFNRKAMTKKDVLEGKSGATASILALDIYRIQTVTGRRYEPGRDPIFKATDGIFANTYPEHEIPDLPEKLMPRDIRAVNRVKNHVRHLLADPRERRLFVDWMSWIVQNPGRHANWAIVLQGVQGDGKSFFGFLLRAVMGVSNVRMLNAQILESDFTDWTVGQCVTCVEEVRLIKHNKFEIVNRIKPYITNNVIEVHPKGKAPYDAINTTSYLLFSNFQDCIPLDPNERRYCVLFSRWQRAEKLNEFKEENPDYYEKLYETLEKSAPALRKWLLEREQEPDFKPLGDAPDTQARRQMIRLSQPEFIQQLDDAISEEIHPLISRELLDLSVLNDKFFDMGVEIPSAKTLSSMLTRYGFESLGKVWMDDRGIMFYSQLPEKFRVLGDDNVWRTDPAMVRKFVKQVKPKSTELDDDEL